MKGGEHTWNRALRPSPADPLRARCCCIFLPFSSSPNHQLHSTESYFCYLCILYIAAGGRVSLNYCLFTAGENKRASSASYSSSRQCLMCKLQSAGSLVSVLAGQLATFPPKFPVASRPRCTVHVTQAHVDSRSEKDNEKL